MSRAVALSAAHAGWLRYRRSWGLWLFLVMGPIGARYMVGNEGDNGVQIRLGDAIPIVTAPVLGIWLGIVVSTLLAPVAWAYLRANSNSRHPAAVVDVTPASRLSIALGRFAADAAVLLAALATLTGAGLILGALIAEGPLQPLVIARNLWLIAAPTLIAIAGLRQLFASVPLLRGGLGDFAFFVCWILSLGLPMLAANQPSSFAANLHDVGGFVRPLVGPGASEGRDFAIGVVDGTPDRIRIDPDRGLMADGYIASRAAWVLIGALFALAGGLLYRPGAAPRRRAGLFDRLRTPPPPRAANPDAPPAARARLALPRLVLAEGRLVLAGRILPLLASAAAFAGLVGGAAEYRHVGSPAALLLLVFALTAHAGRSEARGLQPLTATMVHGPWVRRAALVAAGTLLAAGMAAPAALVGMAAGPLLLALGTGFAFSAAAVLLAAFSGSATTPRILLLIAWYGYFAS